MNQWSKHSSFIFVLVLGGGLFKSVQRCVDRLTNNDILFTMEIWRPDEKSRENKKGTIDVIGGNSLPYLDTRMSYNSSGKLSFKVYSKPGFNMKYVKRGSMHTSMCINAIQQGVLIRLASLTLRTPENEKKRLSKYIS